MSEYRKIYGAAEDIHVLDERDEFIVAYIVRNDDNQSWRIVRVDDDANIYVNGSELHLVHYLATGDKINVNDKRCYIFEKEQIESSSDVINYVKRQKKMIIATFVVFVVIISSLFYKFVKTPDIYDDIRKNEFECYEESVYKLIVEEIHYQRLVKSDDGSDVIVTIDSLNLKDKIPSGSAFLCNDGRFITARHCIEPWIAEHKPDINKKEMLWVAKATTYNALKMGGDTIRERVVSKFRIYNRVTGISLSCSSDTCYFIDDDKLRNLNPPYMNKMLWPYMQSYDDGSTLGDVAYIQTFIKGSIKCAEPEVIYSLKADCPMIHLGYLAAEERLEFERSRLTEAYSNDKCLLHKDTDVDKGLSGGPVMIRHEGELYAVGVLSKKQNMTKRICYSIPVTQLNKAEQRWKE